MNKQILHSIINLFVCIIIQKAEQLGLPISPSQQIGLVFLFLIYFEKLTTCQKPPIRDGWHACIIDNKPVVFDARNYTI